MNRLKNSFFYFVIIGVFSILIYWIITIGSELEVGRNIIIPHTGKSQWGEFIDSMSHNLKHPLAILLAQIITIIIVARIFGWFFKKIRQPSVIGEIIAGIVLGPSVLGLYFPQFSTTLFPTSSLENLRILSQIGLILFMYVIGMELDLKVLKNKAHEAVVISHASIVFPFALGMCLAYYIYQTFAPANTQFLSFGLFMGIAMSITAFPVLARIVQEREIHKTKLGALVITCAAADDITAWCILAAVIAIVKAGSLVSSLYVIGLAILYVILMIYIVRPFLKRVGELHSSRENLDKPIVAIFLIILLISSYLTEVIGIHALFGAFMAGAIIPENPKFRNIFIEKIEDIAVVLLLPLFFVFTGLRTEIGLLNDIYLWQITGIIILVAVIGKFLGSALAAKFVGQNWQNSLTIGALMNTRGLMELVVLNIGYDLGVLTSQMFAMMVIMALVTTFMTGPALDIIKWLFKSKPAAQINEIRELVKYKILISFGNPETGRILLRLANRMIQKINGNASLTVMHLTPSNELHHYNLEEYERDSFLPVITESQHLNKKITTLFKASNDIETDIADVANKGDYDLLLIGLGQSIFEGSLLGKILGFTTRIINPEKLLNTVTGREKLFDDSPLDERTRLILSKTQTAVGIFINKNLTKIDNLIIPILDTNDIFLMPYAQKLIYNSGVQIIFIDVLGEVKNNTEMRERIRAIEQNAPNHIAIQSGVTLENGLTSQQDLMLVSIESWKRLLESKNSWLANIPSTLILTDRKN